MGSAVILQYVLAFVMFVITAMIGIVPLLIVRFMKQKNNQEKSVLSYLTCFAGGVFLATCFLDIIPHINEGYEDLMVSYDLSWHFAYPQFVTCCGFFFIYFIEEVTTLVFGAGDDSHGHSHSAVELKRKVSERRGSVNITTLNMEDAYTWVISDEKNNLLKSLTFAVAMSLHSLLEGFALGVQDSTQRIYALFFSLLLHKSVEAFSIKTVIATILIYSLMAPVGAVIGTILQNAETNIYKDCAILLLESLAAGTFIYVTFIEIMANEKSNQFNHIKQLFFIIVGFSLVTILQIFFSHDHAGDGHAHTHQKQHLNGSSPHIH